jgi:ABC-type transporter Mla maintaining outer membrane lipid asymmetry ATPase subunit MlaF
VRGPVLEIRAVSKSYGGLRPLRIEELLVSAGQQLALVGFDQPTAELFVNLVTGTSLPDRGEVVVFGRATHTIENGTEWLSVVDRFGIVSERAVLLGGLSVVQNIAVPFSLDIEPPSEALRAQAEELAREVGLAGDLLDRRLADIDQLSQLKVRLARALALDPAILLLEHPTARLGKGEAAPWGRAMREAVERRGTAVLSLTADAAFAGAAAPEVLTLDPATGRFHQRRRWFG